jgi:hypothetical protein
MRLAAHVTMTALPYGGVVLADAATLTVAELGVHDARVLDRMLAGAHQDPADSPCEVIAQMTAAGWLEEA